jgi:hypothetical protein
MCVEVMLDKNLIIQMLSYPHFSETIFISPGVHYLLVQYFYQFDETSSPNKNSIHLSSFRNIYVVDPSCKKPLCLCNSTFMALLI